MNAPKASAKELFVLGRLSVRPTHGHEIMRTLAESRSDLWVGLSEKHVYYILKKLERDGFVRVEERSEGGRPTRRVFSLTSAGLREFDRLIRADDLTESISYSDFDVVFGMLSYTDRLTPSEKTAVLVRRTEHLRGVIADATAATDRAAATSAPVLPSRVFEKVIRVAGAELGWLQEVLTEIERDGWPAAKRNARSDSAEGALS
jgi:DNA-binding PadR family transcriptional regulator